MKKLDKNIKVQSFAGFSAVFRNVLQQVFLRSNKDMRLQKRVTQTQLLKGIAANSALARFVKHPGKTLQISISLKLYAKNLKR